MIDRNWIIEFRKRIREQVANAFIGLIANKIIAISEGFKNLFRKLGDTNHFGAP
jgi:hypothetical protein